MSEIWKKFDAAFEAMGDAFDSMHELFDREIAAGGEVSPGAETTTTTHEEETRPDGTRITRTKTVRVMSMRTTVKSPGK